MIETGILYIFVPLLKESSKRHLIPLGRSCENPRVKYIMNTFKLSIYLYNKQLSCWFQFVCQIKACSLLLQHQWHQLLQFTVFQWIVLSNMNEWYKARILLYHFYWVASKGDNNRCEFTVQFHYMFAPHFFQIKSSDNIKLSVHCITSIVFQT